MQVINYLPGSAAIINPNPITTLNTDRLSNFANCHQQLAGQHWIFEVVKTGNVAFWHDQDVNRSVRMDIVKRSRYIIMPNQLFLIAVGNIAKKAVIHRVSIAGTASSRRCLRLTSHSREHKIRNSSHESGFFAVTINLKTTFILSTILAVVLNLVQFAVSITHASNAFTPPWAYASSNARPAISPGPPQLSLELAASPATAQVTEVSITTTPAATNVATILAGAGLNPAYAALYVQAQDQTGTPWQLLAAIHHVESGQSGDTSRTSSAGAEGPMQFMPATFARYALPGAGDITNVQDAVLAAGHYLAANGANRGLYGTALYNYNHSWAYVSEVTSIATSLGL